MQGLGACGITNTNSDDIVALSMQLWDSWPGATANPNQNPICGRQIQISCTYLSPISTPQFPPLPPLSVSVLVLLLSHVRSRTEVPLTRARSGADVQQKW